jgi:heterogeneous nuclear ribonucleoprotein F/H
MMGSGGVSDGYEGSKRPRMMESNPYFAVNAGSPLDVSKRARMMEPGAPYFGGAMGSNAGGSGAGFYPPYSANLAGAGVNTSLQSFPGVRLRGLPFDCEDLDVVKFFTGLDIVDILLVHKNGRFSGEAFVVFPSNLQAEFALHRNRQNMGRRYVEVFRCKKQEYYVAIASEVSQGGGYVDSEYRHSPPPPVRPRKPAEDKSSMEYTEVLKLRGLPYSATTEDIIKFFVEYELTEENVHIGYRSDGKATGEAFVEFPTAEVAKTAMCKDKMTIGTRYVELFPSTLEEASRAKSRGRQ